MDLTYISEGNEKTECFSFDLPSKITCPGATESCKKACYAFKLAQVYSNVGAKYDRNLMFADSVEFIPHMIRNIPKRCEFRIHVSGDFKDVAYVLDWIAIASKRPDVIFYTYTRSWRLAKLWVAIRELAKLPNVNVNLSVDDETGMPNVVDAENFRWCYLSTNDVAPEWLRRTDIIFRTNHNARKGNHQWKRKDAIAKGLNPDTVAPVLHRIAGAVVCPFERGRKLENFSCSQCGLCVDKPKHTVAAYA